MVCLAFIGFGLAKAAHLQLKAPPDSGFWRFVFSQWEHGEWVGWGFWDLIMPAFMFMVGMAMPLSHARRLRDGDTFGQIFRHTLVRAAILIALGIFLMNHAKAKAPWELTNTLAQIGLCYPLVFLCLGRGFREQGIVAVASLVVTWLLFVLHGGTATPAPNLTRNGSRSITPASARPGGNAPTSRMPSMCGFTMPASAVMMVSNLS